MLGDDEDATELAGWVERTVGGTVTRVERVPRWRPAWDVDVEVDGRSLPLHARGEREPRIVMPYRIADEVPVHDLLEAHGLPVPHAYGLCDDPYVLVMDRLPGLVDLSFATDDDEREHLVDDYLELLARIYAIPLEAAEAAGFAIPADSATTGLSFLRRMEERYDRSMDGLPRDPIAVFLRRWLAENVPQHRRAEARFITYDSFQFMFADGRITGLLDFEHADVGDPMMDLAALEDPGHAQEPRRPRRDRRPVRGGDGCRHRPRRRRLPHRPVQRALGHLGGPAAGRSAARDRLAVVPRVVRERRPLGVRGHRGDARVPARTGRDPGPAADPPRAGLPAPGGEPPRRGSSGFLDDYERVGLGRVANHLRRVDEIGAALDAADLDDLAAVLGHRPDPAEADAELVEFVARAGPEHEEALVRLLDVWAQRMHLSMASPQSLMLRHPRLRSLRPDRATARVAEESWPAGAIPGTR